jgi:hypothetical protein
MGGIPAKKSRDRLDNGLLIDVPGIPVLRYSSLSRQYQVHDCAHYLHEQEYPERHR